jgi:transcriptional regulator of acetoin/glycerol metabolism
MSCYQKELITDALRKTKGNMARTAKLLGISRSTLYEKCKVFGL